MVEIKNLFDLSPIQVTLLSNLGYNERASIPPNCKHLNFVIHHIWNTCAKAYPAKYVLPS